MPSSNCTVTATFNLTPEAATPTFSPAAGTYSSAQTVTISSTTPNSTIYYTTNGTTPATSSTVYSSPINVAASETLEAIATATGYSQSAVASANYTINPPPPSFTVSGTTVTVSPGATTGNTSTITVTPSGGFTGSVALTAAVTSTPTGAQDLPTLSFGSTTPVSITNASAGTATLTISTTAPTTASVAYPVRPGLRLLTTGSATLACILLFGIPARRRRWRTTLGLVVLLAVLASGVFACGGGGGNAGGGGGGGGGTGDAGTTAGAYTITVTGTSGSASVTGTVTLTVQ